MRSATHTTPSHPTQSQKQIESGTRCLKYPGYESRSRRLQDCAKIQIAAVCVPGFHAKKGVPHVDHCESDILREYEHAPHQARCDWDEYKYPKRCLPPDYIHPPH